jgi:hypothetical protein
MDPFFTTMTSYSPASISGTLRSIRSSDQISLSGASELFIALLPIQTVSAKKDLKWL